MINTLFYSQSGGTKSFQNTIGGKQFGWKANTDLYAREHQKNEKEETRVAPKPKKA